MDTAFLENVRAEVKTALAELLAGTRYRPGDFVAVGCSTSEIIGKKIGSVGSMEAAEAVYDAADEVISAHGLFLAAQCCEHLNRALVVENAAAEWHRLDEVNAVPQMHAGGSFATTAYQKMHEPVLVPEVKAVAGIDIGGTLIGMHLRPVAVPVRASVSRVGEAILILARSRAPYIGGERAQYNGKLQ